MVYKVWYTRALAQMGGTGIAARGGVSALYQCIQ